MSVDSDERSVKKKIILNRAEQINLLQRHLEIEERKIEKKK